MSWLSRDRADGSRQRSFRPPSGYTPFKERATYAKAPGPLRNGQGFAGMRYKDIVAEIVLLLKARNPAAILGLVVAVTVSPVESHNGPRLSHVSQKVFERQPSIADLYAPAAVVSVGGILGIETATLHVRPDAVDARSGCMRGIAVRRLRFDNVVSAKTAARAAFPIAEQLPKHNPFIAAVTSAKPSGAASSIARVFASLRNNKPAFKPDICQIDELTHVGILS